MVGRKPEKTQTVRVSWDAYKKFKDKAINEDVTISKAIDQILFNGNESEGNKGQDEEKEFVCPVCGKVYDTQSQLNGHRSGAGHWDE